MPQSGDFCIFRLAAELRLSWERQDYAAFVGHLSGLDTREKAIDVAVMGITLNRFTSAELSALFDAAVLKEMLSG